jgi:branched-chain amino acid transport system permease protein
MIHLTLDILIGGAILGAVYSLVAVGLNLQYGVTRMLNVAHGEFLMLGAYLTFFSFTICGINPYASLIIAAPSCSLSANLVYTLLLRGMVRTSRSGEELEFRSLLLCFGLSFVIQNLAVVLWTSNYRGYQRLAGTLSLLGVNFEMNRHRHRGYIRPHQCGPVPVPALHQWRASP